MECEPYFSPFKKYVMPYSPLLVKPFRDELVSVGIQELTTPQDVDQMMAQDGTTLVFVNSVCGCAADVARPGIQQALAKGKTLDRVFSVFAGQDVEATARFRSNISDTPPSSPSIALFKDKKLVYFVPKSRIEGRDANALATDLVAAMKEFA
jgi:putative YphP/YqiW family bacilliredoxin